jgi:hypothetical protein
MFTQFAVTGLVIVALGVSLIASTWPVLRYAERGVSGEAMVSPRLIAWLARILGAALCMLGIATVLA